MNWLILFKATVLLFSLVMFSIQMKGSLENLLDPQVVIVEKRLSLLEVDPPMITICPLNQINQSKLEHFGFETYFDFLRGNMIASKFSNLSFWQIFEELLAYSPNNIDYTITVGEDTLKEMSDFVRRFYPKFGYCWEISDYDIHHEMVIKDWGKTMNANIFLTDKYLSTKPALELTTHHGNAIELHANDERNYFIEVLKISYFDPKNPNDCTNYLDNNYETCLDEALENFASEVMKCQPPWLTSRNACTDMKWKNGSFSNLLLYQIEYLAFTNYDLKDIINMKSFEAKKKCEKPCSETRSYIKSGSLQSSIDVATGSGNAFVLDRSGVEGWRCMSLSTPKSNCSFITFSDFSWEGTL